MKRIFRAVVLVSVMFLFATDVAAQGISQIGVRGGANFTNVAADQETNFQQGTVGGLFVAFEPGILPFPLQLDLLYTEKGFEEPWPADEVVVLYEAIYLESQILGRVPLNLPGLFTVNLLGGIAPSLLVSEQVGIPRGIFEEEPPAFFQDVFSSLDFGLAAGGNLELALAPATLLLDVRYVYGVTDNIQFDRPPFSNRALSFSFGVAYDF